MKHYYCTGGLLITSDIALPSLPISPTGGSDVQISQSPFLLPAIWHVADNLERLGLRPRISFDQDSIWLDWHQHGIFWIHRGNTVHYNDATATSDALEHFLVNEVLACIFFQRGYFLLHGSAAKLPNGSAAVFMGEPGAGKSTTLGFFLHHGCQALTDEIVVIEFVNGIPHVRPFIPVLRLWDTAARRLGYTQSPELRKYEMRTTELTEAVPLHALFSLRKDQYFQVRSGASHRDHLDLFGNFPLPNALLTPEVQHKRFHQAATLVSKCAIHQVKRAEDSFDALDEWVTAYLAAFT